MKRGQFLRTLGGSMLAATAAGSLLRSFGQEAPAAPAAEGGPGAYTPSGPTSIPGHTPIVPNRKNPLTPDAALAAGGALPMVYTPPVGTPARSVINGPGFGNRIAMTFDDGPTPGSTERVLDELRKRNIKATFFMCGRNAALFPSLVQQVKAEGHEIGDHSYTHPKLSGMPEAKVVAEIQGTLNILGTVASVRPVWFRPPYGAFGKSQGPLAVSRNLGICLWDVDPFDWRDRKPPLIADRIVAQTKPGSIILSHDIHMTTAEAVPNFLDRLLEKQFEFATVSELCGPPYEPV